MGFFKSIGTFLSLIVGLGGMYEFFALATGPKWPPTFSRMTQGLRDAGQTKVVFLISIACGIVLMILAQWLYYHFNYEPRSGS